MAAASPEITPEMAAAADASLAGLSKDAVFLIHKVQKASRKPRPDPLLRAAKSCYNSDFEPSKVHEFMDEVQAFLETSTLDVHFHARPRDPSDWQTLCDALGPCLRVRSFGELVRDTPDRRLKEQSLWLSTRNGQERLRVCCDLLPGTVAVASLAKEHTAQCLHNFKLQAHAAIFAQRFYFAHGHVIDAVRLRARKYYIVARLKAANLTKLAAHVQPAASGMAKAITFADGSPKAEIDLDNALPAALKAILEDQMAQHVARQLQLRQPQAPGERALPPQHLPQNVLHAYEIRKVKPEHWIVYTGSETTCELIDKAVSTESQAQQRVLGLTDCDALIVSTALEPPSGGDVALVATSPDRRFNIHRGIIR
ncbi:uncharacterized protein MONBRDRAFT_27892 [Monosiga brevicollis MX1]|uniref:Uncharacterized protein n=1 Tax=Monosiga brevicollis TaxID=81824 RepID=A9V6S3_MONBE|nr:uncharacterized protein MONBRDRAFT_27892 [Monosiga brevicollis MX1]EDQ86784.1 predicted protein [Monosiga brevicollis MX1]|eukprot:XP_001748329.1 hypothetical protein [Monosiga brevicollis MX1]